MNKGLTDKINEHLSIRVQNGELDNENMISIIDNVGSYLNLMTISAYGKLEGLTYNGVLDRIKSGKIKEFNLFGVKFVIDNN